MIFRSCVQFSAAGGSGAIVREYLSTRLEHKDTLSLDSSPAVGPPAIYQVCDTGIAPVFNSDFIALSHVNLLASPRIELAAIVCLGMDHT
jgi:hypothetical protein